ncbi:carboxypeptidase-like regulatory domain-containing protein [Myroides fluvii]|uniref:carboxypeptidase-like regulatory domain-containing protein n=1 Tax=Myroides fluvii TaxID=2572594 RepID=UPI00131D73DA|nr:carboxypeptidase-like regulatory domain-containing protein [Myroides fluvii]
MRELLLLLLLVHGSMLTYAQHRVVLKGTVVDGRFRRPLQEALVQQSGTDNYTLTDATGAFVLSIIPQDNYTMEVSYPTCITQRFTLSFTPEQHLDLGTVVLEEDTTALEQFGLIQLTENDLEDDNLEAEGSASLLQATKNPFQQAVAYSWSQGFYRMRGLDNAYGKVLLNGLIMNKLHHGRPQWNNWGGLNEATRNQTLTTGAAASPQAFGGILGTQVIDTRASLLREGKRLGFSGSNTSYRWRSFGHYASGLRKNKWAYVVSGSYRGAKEGYWPGSNYDATSFFMALEKQINPSHSLNLTGIYAKNKRAKNSSNTQEQMEIKGVKYNAYWGWQQGEKRNARYKDLAEPLLMLTHYWEMNEHSSLTTTAGHQWGYHANSRLDYQDNLNPDPTYYKNLPSFHLSQIDPAYWQLSSDEFNALAEDDPFKQATLAALQQAEEARIAFNSHGQLAWADIYKKNQHFNGQSKIILYEDRQEDHTLSANTNFHAVLTNHMTLNAGITYRQLRSSNFKKAVDLLGGTYYQDSDTFQEEGLRDSDMHHPNREIQVGDTYGYNYRIEGNEAEAFTLFTFNYNHWSFYLAESMNYTAYQRVGLYQSPLFPTTSFGKSDLVVFNNLGIKGGFTYYLSGRHIFHANVAFYNQPPTLQNTFANVRLNNKIIPNLKQETVFSVDANYTFRTAQFQAQITGYLANIHNGTQLNTYYTEGLGLTDSKGQLLSEILSEVDKRHVGLELGAAYQLTPTLKITTAAGIGQSFYTRDPRLQLYANHLTNPLDYGRSKLTNYRLANGPQTAFSVGFEYRAPSFWFISSTLSYLADAYVQIAPLKRTQNFIMDPDKVGLPFENLTPAELHRVLRQEKLPDFALLSINGGKSWRLLNRTIIGFFASIQNLLNSTYRTGGFEQARNATYAEEVARSKGNHPVFGSKYWYGYGRSFFIQVYYNF